MRARLGVLVFASLDELPACAALADVYQDIVARDVADALRYPFSLTGDTLMSVCRDGGIDRVAITHHEGLASFPSVGAMVLADV